MSILGILQPSVKSFPAQLLDTERELKKRYQASDNIYIPLLEKQVAVLKVFISKYGEGKMPADTIIAWVVDSSGERYQTGLSKWGYCGRELWIHDVTDKYYERQGNGDYHQMKIKGIEDERTYIIDQAFADKRSRRYDRR